MKHSTKRLFVILGSFLLLVISVYIYFSLVVPAYDDIQQLRGERQAKQDLLNEQLAAEELVNDLITKFEDSKVIFQEGEGISRSLPRDADIPVLLNQIQGMARISDVNLQSSSFQYLALEDTGDQLVKPIGIVRMSISLVGSYEGIKDYIEALETNVRIMDLSSLRIDGGARLNSSVLTYDLTVDVYYQSE